MEVLGSCHKKPPASLAPRSLRLNYVNSDSPSDFVALQSNDHFFYDVATGEASLLVKPRNILRSSIALRMSEPENKP